MLQRPSLPHTPGPQTPASPPHNLHPCASPLKPRKSPPPPLPHRTQAHGCLHLRHMQVRRHRHPVTARKIRPRCRLATCKPHRDAIPTRYARPAMPPTHHAQALLWRHLNTERKTPTPPTRRAQAPPWRHPNTERKVPPLPTRRDATTARRTPPPRHPQHGTQDCDRDKRPQQWQRRWSSGGDGGDGGQWDGGSSNGSDGEALLLLQTVHILSMQ